MKVILKKRIPTLGHEWDIVTVKDGYAQNFLLPQKLAVPATPKRMEAAQKRIDERVKKMEELIAHAKTTAEKMAKIHLVFKKKAKGSKLYGSITEKDIQEALATEHKMEVSKDMVKMKEHFKETGDHKVVIHLAEGVEVKMAVTVEAE